MTRILFVDDNEMFLDSARDVLEDEGYEVTTAGSGEEAVLRVMNESFSVVIMDIKMGGINGVESFIEMKKHRPGVKVIICTAHLVEHLIRRAEAEGAVAVLKKPVMTDLLLDAIERACREQ
jgi:DNA-binding NtrC family response regulator